MTDCFRIPAHLEVTESLLVSFPTISEPLLEAHLDLDTGTKLNWQEKKGKEQLLWAQGALETGMGLSRQSWWVQEKAERVRRENTALNTLSHKCNPYLPEKMIQSCKPNED